MKLRFNKLLSTMLNSFENKFSQLELLHNLKKKKLFSKPYKVN